MLTHRIFRDGFARRYRVKFYLTDHQELRLLRVGGRCNLVTVESDQLTEYAVMNNTTPLIEKLAEAALAVGVTAAAVVVLQLAMLAG